MSLLSVHNLRVRYGDQLAVDDLSFSVEAGEAVGLVGESGSGKSQTALAILGLLPASAESSGRVVFAQTDLLGAGEKTLNRVRARQVAMVFQDPMTSLNPVLTIGDQITEVLTYHFGRSQTDARREVLALLDRVGIPAPEQRIDQYPHEFSGGQLQRIMIAMVIACEPQLLIADEPTTALDVTIQAQVLLLLRRLAREKNLAVLFITHDLSVVATICDRVSVMYAGEIVESGTVEAVFAEPSHPYTRKLLGTVPAFGRDKARLEFIPGQVPDMGNLPHGCAFQARCANAVEICGNRTPPVIEVAEGHYARCHLAATNQVRQP